MPRRRRTARNWSSVSWPAKYALAWDRNSSISSRTVASYASSVWVGKSESPIPYLEYRIIGTEAIPDPHNSSNRIADHDPCWVADRIGFVLSTRVELRLGGPVPDRRSPLGTKRTQLPDRRRRGSPRPVPASA